MFKKSFWGFLEILIYFLDLKIQFDTILTHKGHLRSPGRWQFLENDQEFSFSQKNNTYMSKMSFHRFLGILNWLLPLFLSLETSSVSSQTYLMTSWTYIWWFCEKNWILGYFPRIWHLRRDFEWPLWVMMTSNLIFKSRNGISIPKNPKND